MAKFERGKSGNPQGRPSGATNKIIRPVKESISDFLSEKLTELPDIWLKLSARDKVNLLKDLLPYFLPKMQTIAVGVEFPQMTDDQLDYIIDSLINQNHERH